nr:PREDICTED: uncharacterized protein C16orf59 homolog [Opisthocomus hoazin]
MGSNAAGEGAGALPKTGWFAGSGRRQRARSLAVGRSLHKRMTNTTGWRLLAAYSMTDREFRVASLRDYTKPKNRPSPRELEELELLNRALEKALRVRKSILKTPLEAQGAIRETSAGEGPAPKNAEEQQVPAPVEGVPESTKVRALSKKPASLKKPSPYQLRAPYRTDPEVKKLCRLKLPLPYRKAYSRNSRGQTCDSAGMLAVPLLCYSSFQELSDLFALKLKVSILHQEIALQKRHMENKKGNPLQVMMAELLPVLESRLYPEAPAAQLYRAIYTQLCEGGKRFPVLVRDELAD